MNTKTKKTNRSWLIAGLAFVVSLILILELAVKANKKFEVVYSLPVIRQGYENEPAAVRVYSSPHLKWKEQGAATKIIGYIFLIGILPAAWYVGTDRHNYNIGKGIAIFASPIILCSFFWYYGYSNSLDQGSLVRYYDKFVSDFEISPDNAKKIIEQGTSGVNIKDESGKLTSYFSNK